MDPIAPYRQLISGYMKTLANPRASDEELNAAATEVLEQSPGALDLCLALLSSKLAAVHDPGRAAIGAMVAGALVEMGADPRPAFLTMIAILARVLPPMERFLACCRTHSPGDDPAAPPDRETVTRAAADEPQGAAAWEAMRLLYRPAVAVFSPSAEGRALLHAQLGQAPGWLRAHDTGVYLWILWRVLDDEPLLVRHPGEGKEVQTRISGVADMQQLMVLLMDALIGGGILSGEPPHPDWVAVARGEAPQELGNTVRGGWPLPPWTLPADIPVVDGERRLVLEDASQETTWSNTRIFAAMPAVVEVVETKSQKQCSQ